MHTFSFGVSAITRGGCIGSIHPGLARIAGAGQADASLRLPAHGKTARP